MCHEEHLLLLVHICEMCVSDVLAYMGDAPFDIAKTSKVIPKADASKGEL